MDGDSFGQVSLAPTWHLNGDVNLVVGFGEFGVQKREPHYSYKSEIITLPLLSKGMRVDEITKVVTGERKGRILGLSQSW